MRLSCGEDGVVEVQRRLELISGTSAYVATGVMGIFRQLSAPKLFPSGDTSQA